MYIIIIEALLQWWDKCLKMSIMITCRSDVYRLLPMCHLCIRVKSKVLSIRVFVHLCSKLCVFIL